MALSFLCYREAARAEMTAKRRGFVTMVLKRRGSVHSGGFQEGQSTEGKGKPTVAKREDQKSRFRQRSSEGRRCTLWSLEAVSPLQSIS